MLETYFLTQLAAFAKYGTLSEAAKRLRLSQSVLSRSMKRLEKILDAELFMRTKNRIALNETGKLAADYAMRILAQQREMADKVRELDRRSKTISVGCCAPVPLNEMLFLLPPHFAGLSVSSEINGDEMLLKKLCDGALDLAVLHENPTDENLFAQRCGGEKLYVSLPPSHPSAKKRAIRLAELDGQHILLYVKIGFWYDLCKKKMPNAKFLVQHERDVFKELVGISKIPSFTTDVLMQNGCAQPDRVNVPVSDPEADVTYYCVCRAEQKSRFHNFFRALKATPNFVPHRFLYSL